MEYKVSSSLPSKLKNINMNICAVSYAHLDKRWVAEKVMSPFFRIYMVVEGSGILNSPDGRIIMQPNCIYVVPSFYEFSYSCPDRLEKLFFHITIPMADGYDITKGTKKIIVFENKKAIIYKFLKLCGDISQDNLLQIKSMLYSLCCELLVHLEKRKDKLLTSNTKLAIKYVNSHLSASLSVKEVSQGIFVSLSKLQKSFKTDMGISVGKYIDDRIMFAAESMIRSENKTIKEISEELGFCDQFYFSRRFAAYFGCPPLKYRKRCIT